MSSILDALKKSERQRSLGRDLIFRNGARTTTPRLTGFAIAVLAALIVLVLAIGALLFSLRESEPPADLLSSPADSTTNTTQVGSASTVASVPPPADAARSVDGATVSGSQTAPALQKPAPSKPAKAADTSHPPVAAPLLPSTGEAPWLSSLPQDFRDSLPPLAVNIHVYSPDRSQRILYINNRPVQQGERIEGGVMVEEIVHNGVVLQYRGQRFKLPRPS